MTTPAVQEEIDDIKESISHCQEGEYEFNYKDVLEHQLKEAEKCATLQQEWVEKVVKGLETDDKLSKCEKCGQGFCSYEEIYLTKKQVLEALGIEQEEKK